MFDIGWQEIFIVATIAIIVVGPKDLPHVLRTVAKFVNRARGMVREFQSGLDEVVREAGVDDIKESVERGANFDMGGEIEKIIDPEGDIANEMDMGDIEKELDDDGSSAADGKPESDVPESDDGNMPGDNNSLSDDTPSSPNKTSG